MHIEAIHTFIQFLSKKERGKFFDPEEIDAAINRSSMEQFKVYFGLPEVVTPLGHESDQAVQDSLRVFKTTVSLTPTLGVVTLPEDYAHLSMLAYQPSDATKEEIKIKLLEDARWHDKINDPISGPTTSYPYANIQGSTIVIRPKTLPNVKLTYLKNPSEVRWGYTLDGSVPEFAETGGITGDSIDIDWPPIVHNDIIFRAIGYLGLNMEAQDLVQISEMKKVRGQ